LNDEGVLVAERIAREIPDEVVDPTIEDIQAEITNLSRPNFNLVGVLVLINEVVTMYDGLTGEL
jgi:hypothetical protein